MKLVIICIILFSSFCYSSEKNIDSSKDKKIPLLEEQAKKDLIEGLNNMKDHETGIRVLLLISEYTLYFKNPHSEIFEEQCEDLWFLNFKNEK